ncbi:hypothetical protein Pmar_PMAR019177 [Perkinsus marinus ATCC 50983]|uniref:Uncharacterized protein n=1 Tax=Perkinsus marinus (strain ATCC 50983 / TXsc) TaxID=423536 RepID=C5KU30_PERM5|nr:hypothetical protein Pmar_PMAR019177 [Perkinsus marinus ATCC 50983]EER12072.1 hypothetical protein Pmar_PMAR019177 [Perkinsus marinus ATCC 50983]|eukprot:XP_002780277.1 hypothetical protein Pmar_PMAR019177 [Perkinsus marinus ATCC 50983]
MAYHELYRSAGRRFGYSKILLRYAHHILYVDAASPINELHPESERDILTMINNGFFKDNKMNAALTQPEKSTISPREQRTLYFPVTARQESKNHTSSWGDGPSETGCLKLRRTPRKVRNGVVTIFQDFYDHPRMPFKMKYDARDDMDYRLGRNIGALIDETLGVLEKHGGEDVSHHREFGGDSDKKLMKK